MNGSSDRVVADIRSAFSIEAKRRLPSTLKALYPISSRVGMRAVAGGMPHPETFAITSFSATLNGSGDVIHVSSREGVEKSTQTSTEECLQYVDSTGIRAAKNLIKELFLSGENSPKYSSWDVVVNGGNSQGFDACFRMLCDPGDGILVEEYTYTAAMEMMRAQRIVPIPVEMDHEGMLPSDIPRAISAFKSKNPTARVRVVYVIPSGQNPTGAVMSLTRRQQLLDACSELDLFVIEDTPYSMLEFPQYQTPDSRSAYEYPGFKNLVPSLVSLDTEGRVIHLCTFSKILGPGFRMGFAVASEEGAKQLKLANESNILSACGFAQGFVVEILKNWGRDGLENHAIHLQQMYTLRRDWLVDAAKAHLPSALVDFTVPRAGMFLWIKLNIEDKPAGTATMIYETLIEKNVLFVQGDHFKAGETVGTDSPYFRVAFSFVDRDTLVDVMKVFGEVLSSCL